MTTTKLLILGSLRELGAAHGYQVRRDLEARGVHLWANIQQGSIYHALRTLHSDNLITVVTDAEADSKGPARTEYTVTVDGEKAFIALLERALSSHEGDVSETIAGIGLMTELPRRRVIELLERRVEQYRRWRAQVVDVYESSHGDWMHHVEAIRLWAHTADSAVAWTQGLIQRLHDGEYAMADEAPAKH